METGSNTLSFLAIIKLFYTGQTLLYSVNINSHLHTNKSDMEFSDGCDDNYHTRCLITTRDVLLLPKMSKESFYGERALGEQEWQ